MKNIFLFCLLIAVGCAKPPDYPIEPVIEFMQLSTNFSSQKAQRETGESPIIATLSFTDGDGDIGNDDNETTIFIIDLRDTTEENSATRLPKVPEAGANNGISGEISFRLLPTCCLFPPEFQDQPNCQFSASYPMDTLIYEVYIMDRAGNVSNRVKLDPIFIMCD